MYIIGIDIGGTTTKAGLIKDNKIIDKVDIKTDRNDVMRGVAKVMHEIMSKGNVKPTEIKGISLGCPGIVKNGIVLSSANLNLKNVNLYDEMSKITSLPVYVKNDGDMATLAEYRLGAGVGSNNMVMLIFGTGVGGGIITSGFLYEGQGGSAELGHIPFVYGGLICGCGNRGCMERYVSCMALSALAKDMLDTGEKSILENKDIIPASEIDRAYMLGDEVASRIVEEYSSRLAQAFIAYCNIFRPDVIVVGGGLTHAPNIIAKAIEKAEKLDYGYMGAPRVDIRLATLGGDAGILAGAVLFE